MKKVLPVIVLSQLSCTSLWFAVNAVMPSIGKEFQLETGYLAHLSSAVQFGFISGTLLFAILGISDRFSPSKIFFVAAIAAALCNIAIMAPGLNGGWLLVFRWMTGFFLAGIYPVGMKIVADHYSAGLGKSLGYLVGALVLGTSFPHALRSFSDEWPWKNIIYITSALSVIGGFLVVAVIPDGPYRQKAQKFNISAFRDGFSNPEFRSAAFGYFGHMWELYSFWIFLPVLLAYYVELHPNIKADVPLLSFFVIASGSVACVIAGMIAVKAGTKKTAASVLTISGMCCVLSPLVIYHASFAVLVLFLLIWGMSVIADSPLFSTMIAQHAPAASRGSSLTLVNCIGFSVTVVSIQVINILKDHVAVPYMFLALAAGPVFGLYALKAYRFFRLQ